MAVTTRRPRQAPSTTDLVAKLDERMGALEQRMEKARKQTKSQRLREMLKEDIARLVRARRRIERASETTEALERFTASVEEKWTPIIGQGDKCPPPPLVRLLHAALGHEPLPAYTASGVLRPRP